mmetsp:Transcript_12161/g.28434  ORF Transcript_12161/g.28434 Transcript_12161/m.28434 type:complete len:211 (-) Transcript_12161:396-1028(-)
MKAATLSFVTSPSITYLRPSLRSSITTLGRFFAAANLSTPKCAKASGKSLLVKYPDTKSARNPFAPSRNASRSPPALSAKRKALGTASSSNTSLRALWSPFLIGIASCRLCRLTKDLRAAVSDTFPSYTTVGSSNFLSTVTPSLTPSLDMTPLLEVCTHATASRIVSAALVQSSVTLPANTMMTLSFSLSTAALSALSSRADAGPARLMR